MLHYQISYDRGQVEPAAAEKLLDKEGNTPTLSSTKGPKTWVFIHQLPVPPRLRSASWALTSLMKLLAFPVWRLKIGKKRW